jgi:hypothetical protein
MRFSCFTFYKHAYWLLGIKVKEISWREMVLPYFLFLKGFAHLLIGLLVLLVFIFLSSSYFLNINLIGWLAGKGFLLFCRLSLHFAVSFAVQKVCNLMWSHLSILIIISWAIGILFRKLLSMPTSWHISLHFPLVVSMLQI